MNCVSKQVLCCYPNPFKKTLRRFRVASTQLHPTSSSAPIFSSVSTTQVLQSDKWNNSTSMAQTLVKNHMAILSIVLLEAPNTTYSLLSVCSQDYLGS